MEKLYNVEEIREALIRSAWNVNARKENVEPLLVVYPNEVLMELSKEVNMDKYWIPDKIKLRRTRQGAPKN